MSKQKSIDNPTKRGFRLIIQAGGPAFLRLPPFFPVVGNVEVSGRFIDRLTNPPKRAIFKPSRYKGVVRPFLGPLRLNGRGGFLQRFFAPPSLTLSPPKYFTSWERTILSKLLTSRNLNFNNQSTTNQKG